MLFISETCTWRLHHCRQSKVLGFMRGNGARTEWEREKEQDKEDIGKENGGVEIIGLLTFKPISRVCC